MTTSAKQFSRTSSANLQLLIPLLIGIIPVGAAEDSLSKEDIEHTVIAENLNSIILVAKPSKIKKFRNSDIEGITVDGVTLPGNQEALESRLRPFLGKPITRDAISQIKKEIIAYYRERNRPAIHIRIPEQNISNGVLQVLVYESKVGKIRVKGNQYFSNQRLMDYIHLKPGDQIDADTLVQDLNWMNRNTFRQTDAFFTPGKDGTTDIELLTKDRRTWRVYAGSDNTGLQQTGPERWFGGINFGNFLWSDQLFTYQFTSASNYEEFNASTFNWTIPLPWRHVLSFYGGYSQVRTNNLEIPFNPGFGTHGQSMQASMRWDIPLYTMVDFLHECTWGADWKRTNNNLTFLGTEFYGNSVNLFQVVGTYNLGYDNQKVKVSLTWENFFSPGSFLPDQSRRLYNDLREFARPLYYYTRLFFAPTFRLGKAGANLQIMLRGQWADQNLLSSEQFGIGGYNTVRGYFERLFNGDDAFVGNLELRTPIWPLFWQRSKLDTIQLLGFYDYGKVWVHKAMKAEPKQAHIDSMGAGLRYTIDPYVTARVDWGYALRKVDIQDKRYRFHFGFIASY